MTDEEIIDYLKNGGVGNFGATGRNTSIMNLMGRLEKQGLVGLTDVSTSQETQFEVRWISEKIND